MYASVNGIQLDVYEHDPGTRATVRRNPDFIRDNLLSFPAPSNLNYLVILEDKSKDRACRAAEKRVRAAKAKVKILKLKLQCVNERKTYSQERD
eukprot:2499648-Rhodomonas_salina.1